MAFARTHQAVVFHSVILQTHSAGGGTPGKLLHPAPRCSVSKQGTPPVPSSLHQRSRDFACTETFTPVRDGAGQGVLPGTAVGAGSSQLWRQGSSRPPSWLSSPSQPVLYLDIDNPNSSPNHPVMDSTGSTLFIYHLFRLQSSVSLQSPSQATALGTHLSFFRGGQCSSASNSVAAVRPLPST